MRRMLASVFNKATSFWAGKAEAWRLGSTSSTAVESSSHVTRVSTAVRRQSYQTHHAVVVASPEVATLGSNSSSVNAKQPDVRADNTTTQEGTPWDNCEEKLGAPPKVLVDQRLLQSQQHTGHTGQHQANSEPFQDNTGLQIQQQQQQQHHGSTSFASCNGNHPAPQAQAAAAASSTSQQVNNGQHPSCRTSPQTTSLSSSSSNGSIGQHPFPPGKFTNVLAELHSDPNKVDEYVQQVPSQEQQQAPQHMYPPLLAAAAHQHQEQPAQQAQGFEQQSSSWPSRSTANGVHREQHLEQPTRFATHHQLQQMQQQVNMQSWTRNDLQQSHHQRQQQFVQDVPPQAQQAAEDTAEYNPGRKDIIYSTSGVEYVLPHPKYRKTEVPPDVAVINSPETARAVVDQLLQYAKQGIQWVDKDGRQRTDGPDQVYFACDTEVADIDVKMQSPVGHGTVICFSIYAHPQADFREALAAAGGRSQALVAAAAAATADAATTAAAADAAAGMPDGQASGVVKMNRIWVDLAAGWYDKYEAGRRAQEEVAAAARQAEAARLEAAQLAEQQQAATDPTSSPKKRRRRGPNADAGQLPAAAAAVAEVPGAAAEQQLGAALLAQADVQQATVDMQTAMAEAAAASSAADIAATHAAVESANASTAAAAIDCQAHAGTHEQPSRSRRRRRSASQQQHSDDSGIVSGSSSTGATGGMSSTSSSTVSEANNGGCSDSSKSAGQQPLPGNEAGTCGDPIQASEQQRLSSTNNSNAAGFSRYSRSSSRSSSSSSSSEADGQQAAPSRRKYKGARQRGPDKWGAEKCKGRDRYCFTFRTEEEAVRAWDLATLWLDGDKAKTNFPKEEYAPEGVQRMGEIMKEQLNRRKNGGNGVDAAAGSAVSSADQVLDIIASYVHPSSSPSSSSSSSSGSSSNHVVATTLLGTGSKQDTLGYFGSSSSTCDRSVAAATADPAVNSALLAETEANDCRINSKSRASRSRSPRKSSSVAAISSSSGGVDHPADFAVFNDTIPAPTVQDITQDDTAKGIIQEFWRFFADPSVQKVWHNYGFDRHVLERLGFKMAGFGGDTLHMSRLWDASRKLSGGYALDSLSKDTKINMELEKTFREDEVGVPKSTMKDRFGLKRRKADGLLTAAPVVPHMHVLHTDDIFRPGWIDYSALDAKATWNVHRALISLLKGQYVVMDSYLCEKLLPHKPELQTALHLAHEADSFKIDEEPQQAKRRGPAAPGQKQRGPPRPKSNKGTSLPSAAGPGTPQAAAAGGVLDDDDGGSSSSSDDVRYTLWDLYCDYWKPFGEVLTCMEKEGVRVNRDHLAEQEIQAVKDQKQAEEHFRNWAKRYVPGAEHMNVNSQVQIRHLLFPEPDVPSKVFKATNPDPNAKRRYIDFELYGLWGKGQPGGLMVDKKTEKGIPAVSGAVLWTLVGKPGAAKKALDELDELEAKEAAENSAATNGSGSDSIATAHPNADDQHDTDHDHRLMDDHDRMLEDGGNGSGDGAAAAADASKVVHVCSAETDPEKYATLMDEAAKRKLGKMYVAMGGGREGIEACLALEKLIEVSAIDKLLSAFIQPLQQDNISTTHPMDAPDAAEDTVSGNSHACSSSAATAGTVVIAEGDENAEVEHTAAGTASESSSGSNGSSSGAVMHRVHCSLNLNTETGRLSARRPNLQNQPALEKDRYKVRKAFCAAPDQTLVVADYGQLELRLLAHMADCKSMIRAFELGGDFHSRTALGMYDYIQESIDKGECLLEWDGAHEDGPPPAPLLKDKYASERRKAKILNFSIAYGKTAHGLSKDWGVSLEEAEQTVNRWYADRPEVREWQARTRSYAKHTGWVNTMIGRRRGLEPAIRSQDKWLRARAERAAINTPIQGSAADVASAAMLSIVQDKWLNEKKWKLLLQVHDEVMLEGPKETAEEAKARVVACMENPWENLIGFKGKPLRVDLVVDANIADTWYEAK